MQTQGYNVREKSRTNNSDFYHHNFGMLFFFGLLFIFNLQIVFNGSKLQCKRQPHLTAPG